MAQILVEEKITKKNCICDTSNNARDYCIGETVVINC